jgi:hypothetical protein
MFDYVLVSGCYCIELLSCMRRLFSPYSHVKLALGDGFLVEVVNRSSFARRHFPVRQCEGLTSSQGSLNPHITWGFTLDSHILLGSPTYQHVVVPTMHGHVLVGQGHGPTGRTSEFTEPRIRAWPSILSFKNYATCKLFEKKRMNAIYSHQKEWVDLICTHMYRTLQFRSTCVVNIRTPDHGYLQGFKHFCCPVCEAEFWK